MGRCAVAVDAAAVARRGQLARGRGHVAGPDDHFFESSQALVRQTGLARHWATGPLAQAHGHMMTFIFRDPLRSARGCKPLRPWHGSRARGRASVPRRQEQRCSTHDMTNGRAPSVSACTAPNSCTAAAVGVVSFVRPSGCCCPAVRGGAGPRTSKWQMAQQTAGRVACTTPKQRDRLVPHVVGVGVGVGVSLRESA